MRLILEGPGDSVAVYDWVITLHITEVALWRLVMGLEVRLEAPKKYNRYITPTQPQYNPCITPTQSLYNPNIIPV